MRFVSENTYAFDEEGVIVYTGNENIAPIQLGLEYNSLMWRQKTVFDPLRRVINLLFIDRNTGEPPLEKGNNIRIEVYYTSSERAAAQKSAAARERMEEPDITLAYWKNQEWIKPGGINNFPTDLRPGYAGYLVFETDAKTFNDPTIALGS